MIKRESLRDQIADEVRTRIVDGRLSSEDGLSEAELARELGVSRTPLREALIALEQEGFLDASPGKGFSVLPMHADDYKKLVPIIGALERLALEALPALTPERIAELNELNNDLLASNELKEPRERIAARLKADLMWHELLLETSTNDRALQILRQLKLQWRRYEYVFWQHTDDTSRSVQQHNDIVAAIERNDYVTAGSLTEKQWSLCLVEKLSQSQAADVSADESADESAVESAHKSSQ